MAQTFHVYDMQPGLTQVKLSSKFFIQVAQLLMWLNSSHHKDSSRWDRCWAPGLFMTLHNRQRNHTHEHKWSRVQLHIRWYSISAAIKFEGQTKWVLWFEKIKVKCCKAEIKAVRRKVLPVSLYLNSILTEVWEQEISRRWLAQESSNDFRQRISCFY